MLTRYCTRSECINHNHSTNLCRVLNDTSTYNSSCPFKKTQKDFEEYLERIASRANKKKESKGPTPLLAIKDERYEKEQKG